MNKNKPLPFYLIESFLAAAECPTFQLAAERLQLTQSALSRQMLLFEEALPHKVFTLEGRKKVLTKYGKTLYNLLSPPLSQTQGLIDQASLLFAKPEMAHVKICGRGELLDKVAGNLNFSGQVSFLNMDNRHALDAVLNRNCDIGIVHSGVDSSELVLKPLFSNRLRIVIPKSLLKEKPLSKSELATKLQRLPCLAYKTDEPVTERFLKAYGINTSDLNVSRVYSNFAVLIKMVQAGRGWAVIPSNLELPSEDHHIFQLKGKTQDERNFYLCFRRELKDAVWSKELLNEIINVMKV